MAIGVLSRGAIERAIDEYDDLGRDAFLSKHGFGRATAYALVVDGREYDPKAIAGVAYGYDHPGQGALKNTEFDGGLALRRAYGPAGFDVVLRTTPGETALRDLLERFMTEYANVPPGPLSRAHPVMSTLRALEEGVARSKPLLVRPQVKVKASAGQGNWAAAPWVALLDARETNSTQRGVYPVLLFREDMSGVYVTVAQGTKELKQQGRAYMLAQLQTTAARVRGLAQHDLHERSFALDDAISLGKGSLARDYAASTIAHKFTSGDQCQPMTRSCTT